MIKYKQAPVITIDGPGGTGKGTIGQLLAQNLKWHFLDSGALYRILAFATKQAGIQIDDCKSIVNLAKNLNINFQMGENLTQQIFLNHKDVTQKIRNESCGQTASVLAVYPEIRTILLEKQRAFAMPPGLVCDGRDMGTVVFPNANLKLFLTASLEERASRRYLQLKTKEKNVSLAQVVDDLTQRDERDSMRQHSPLNPASDAVIIDTTELTIEEVYSLVWQLIQEMSFVSDG